MLLKSPTDCHGAPLAQIQACLQEPVSDSAGDSSYDPSKEESRHSKESRHRKDCRHKRKHHKKPVRVVRPESPAVDKVQDDLCKMKVHCCSPLPRCCLSTALRAAERGSTAG